MTPSPLKTDALRGLSLMVAASVAFAVMNGLIKVAAQDGVPASQIAFVRSFVGVLAIGAVAGVRRTSLRVINVRVMALRTFVGTLSMLATFYALGRMPLADAAALFNTTPLFLLVLGHFVLRERVSARLAMAIAVGFVGVLVVLRPTSTGGTDGLIALAAGAFSAVAMMSLRTLGRTETADVIVFWFSAGAAMVSALLSVPGFVAPAPIDVALLVFAGIAGNIGQIVMTRAYQLDVAARVGGGTYLSVVMSTLLGTLYFGETISGMTAAGTALILIAGALLVRDARIAARGSASTEDAPVVSNETLAQAPAGEETAKSA